MVRWRTCLVLALLLLLPRVGGKLEEDEDDERNEGDEDEEDEDDDDEDSSEKPQPAGRRAPAFVPSPKAHTQTRTPKKLPLECYVCAYKSETAPRACLDPTKYRVHSITCQNVDDKCFTSVISKDKSYETVVRGCRTGCVASEQTTCCELNRCNNQAFAMPLVPRALPAGPIAASLSASAPALAATDSKSAKSYPSTVLFFVTVLLVLQTVVKVSFV